MGLTRAISGFYWVLPSFSRAQFGFTGFHCVLIKFSRVSLRLKRFQLDCTEFHWILSEFSCFPSDWIVFLLVSSVFEAQLKGCRDRSKVNCGGFRLEPHDRAHQVRPQLLFISFFIEGIRFLANIVFPTTNFNSISNKKKA